MLPVQLPEGLTAWVITRYGLGRAALTDPRFIKDLRKVPKTEHSPRGRRYAEDVFAVEGRHMLNSDPPDHARLRRVVAKHFSANAVEQQRREIQSIATNLAATLSSELVTSAQVDLMSTFARPLPEQVLGLILGLPAHNLPMATSLTRALGHRENPSTPAMRTTFNQLVDMIHDLIRDPDSLAPTSLLASLCNAVADGGLSRRESVSTCLMLLGAGISSTAIAIGHGAAMLTTHNALLRQLVNGGRASEVVEELLRHHPPFSFSPWRYAREDVTIEGVTIPAGAVVFVLIAAVNRDPLLYERPEELLISRNRVAHSLTFGYGSHFCVGAHLARAELEIGLRAIFEAIPTLRLASSYDSVQWHGLLFDRAPVSLPVAIGE
ncbi:cytochrome P450 [Jatrophihabitans sp. GAS493]|uniref:cytochrome P450 n=1 Tax=Jatrophihabitans sp. GAS493 TaxID=1907575 RepID=UPI0012FD0E33|nr:cytochrome P450 [Jatrophihabitans sp. GAS493]